MHGLSKTIMLCRSGIQGIGRGNCKKLAIDGPSFPTSHCCLSLDRRKAAINTLPNPFLEPIELANNSTASISETISTSLKSHVRVELLICNAGIL
jgi:NADP-dependent 3-hydroxy acid dehydrogenase YdfG